MLTPAQKHLVERLRQAAQEEDRKVAGWHDGPISLGPLLREAADAIVWLTLEEIF